MVAMIIVQCQGLTVVIGLAQQSSVCRYPLTKSGRVVGALAHRSMREAGGRDEKRASQKIRYRYDARATWLSRDCLGLDWE
jgi:hypothetical protein